MKTNGSWLLNEFPLIFKKQTWLINIVIFLIEYSYDKAFTEFVRLRIGVIEIKIVTSPAWTKIIAKLTGSQN